MPAVEAAPPTRDTSQASQRRVLRETPIADAVELPKIPVRRHPELPGDARRPQVRHTVSFLWDAHGFMQRMRERHGPNFAHGYFGFEPFVVGEPDIVREVLLDREMNFSSRLGWDHPIGELFHGGLMLRDFDDHRAQRNIMQTAFRPAAMKGYLAIINPFFESALSQLPTRRKFGFYPTVKQLGLHLAAELLLGVSFDEREGRKVSRAFVNAIRAAVSPIRRPIPPSQYWRGMRGRALLKQYFAAQITERRRSDKTDMFTQLCRAADENGDRLTDEEIVQHMIFLILAAHDTTASAVTTAVSALVQLPQWQERIRDEVSAFESPVMRYEDRDALVETDWVFKESIRMQPPVAFMVRRAVRDCRLGPYHLPKNTAVSPCSIVTHYLPEWWTDPNRFDPERFSPERAEHKQHPGLYYPFGGGAHMCLGVHLAGMQGKAFLYQLLRRYRITLRGKRPIKFNAVPIPRPIGGLPIELTPVS